MLPTSTLLARRGVRALSTDTTSYDVVIMGGGVIGSSVAHFLSRRMPGSAICVVERDSTVRSEQGIRIAIPRNITSCALT